MSGDGSSNASDVGATTPAAFFSSAKIGKIGYAIGIFVGLLFLITTITLASYYCSRSSAPAPQPRRRRRSQLDRGADDMEIGVDSATLKSWSKVTYAEAKNRDRRVASSGGCCSVCLVDFSEDDDEALRLLPECGHLFHVICVDPWLRRRPTCPVCRSSPAPSPMPTPLAEVVPLSTALS